jgi:hypothetical protein
LHCGYFALPLLFTVKNQLAILSEWCIELGLALMTNMAYFTAGHYPSLMLVGGNTIPFNGDDVA